MEAAKNITYLTLNANPDAMDAREVHVTLSTSTVMAIKDGKNTLQ